MIKSLRSIKKHHIYGFVFVAVVISFIVGRTIYSYKRQDIFKHGITTVCKVYRYTVNGQVSSLTGYYYYYYKGKSISGSDGMHTKIHFNPTNKYFILYFLPEDLDNCVVDFSQEICPDSVYKYFPKGKNPFEEEIKQLKK